MSSYNFNKMKLQTEKVELPYCYRIILCDCRFLSPGNILSNVGFRNNGTMFNDCAYKESNYAPK
jgi:hypothetical protein